jgi:hypothetical protein
MTAVSKLERMLSEKQVRKSELSTRRATAEQVVIEQKQICSKLASDPESGAKLDQAELALRSSEDRVRSLSAALLLVESDLSKTEAELSAAVSLAAARAESDKLLAQAEAFEKDLPQISVALQLLNKHLAGAKDFWQVSNYLNYANGSSVALQESAELVCRLWKEEAARVLSHPNTVAPQSADTVVRLVANK